MLRIDSQRREYRVDLRFEEPVETTALLGRQISHADQPHTPRSDGREKVSVQAAAELAEHLAYPRLDLFDLLFERNRVFGREAGNPSDELAPQVRDAHHVKLVEIRPKD